ncbi:MAG: SCO family protein [Phycisphaerales bacterium JB040]
MAGDRLTFPIMLGGLLAAGAGVGALVALLTRGLPNSERVPEQRTGEDNGSYVDAGVDPANPYSQFRVPPFNLVGADGRPVTEAAFDGEVTFVSFFFASCPGPCPIITAKMKELQEATAGTGVRLMSISVDGVRDTPEVISNYASGYNADPQRWTFATGDPALVEALLAEMLGYALVRRPSDPVRAVDGSTIANILHPTRIMLVGPDRRLLTSPASATDAEGVNRLLETAQAATGEG